jgi:magnesium-transporting ATPase (P-type)
MPITSPSVTASQKVRPLLISRSVFTQATIGCKALAAQVEAFCAVLARSLERHMTSGVTSTPRSGGPPAAGELAWHTLGADQVLCSEGVDRQSGLSSDEAGARAERFGPNEFAAGRAESRWHAFVRQYRDPMQLVLLAAGIGSLYPLKQLGTGILLILLTLFNAVEGLHQEGKAAAAVSALQKMVIITARVRRDGQLAEIPAGQP